MNASDNKAINTIMEISDNNTFEVFNDQEIEKVRFVFIPDQNNELLNIKWMLQYKDFKKLSSIIRSLSLNQFEELKSMMEKLDE
jgi:hypothetical protein